jgi:hypothetical protein
LNSRKLSDCSRSSRSFTLSKAQHAVDREIAADVAQELDVVELQQPVGIVDHDRVGRAVAVAQDAAVDLLDALDVRGDLFDRQQLALFVAERSDRPPSRCRRPSADRP